MVKPFLEVSRQTLADRVYAQLHDFIINGRLADGTELNQVELAEQFGVSRVPVREALRRLQAENLVMANPYQSHVVRAISPDDVIEMVELREDLEVFALRRAMQRMRSGTQEPVELAATVLAKQSAKLPGERWLALDREFHRQFHTPVVDTLIDDLRIRVHRYFQIVLAGHSRRSQAMEEHVALLEAVQAGNEDQAVAVLRRHVSHTRELIDQHLAQGAAHGTAAGAEGLTPSSQVKDQHPRSSPALLRNSSS